jgi:hypothetical protein
VRIAKYGLSAEGPSGWEARIFRREPQLAGEVTHPVLHACTRELPADRGDFGSGVVENLGLDDVFVSLVEFGADVADQGLFAPQGRPVLRPSQFSPDRIQRQLPNITASQHFFSEGGRAFCLFVVLGAHSRRMALAPRAERFVTSLRVTDRRQLLRSGGLP